MGLKFYFESFERSGVWEHESKFDYLSKKKSGQSGLGDYLKWSTTSRDGSVSHIESPVHKRSY